MQLPAILGCLLLTSDAALGAQLSPVQKVIQLLKGMKDKGTTEMATEQKQHEEFVAFCDQTLVDKQRLIGEARENIAKATAATEKYDASITRLTTGIQTHQKDIDTVAKEKDAAIMLRTEEATNFKAMDEEYSESIAATGKALTVLKAQISDRDQGSSKSQSLLEEREKPSLLQLAENTSPHEARQILAHFLQRQQPLAAGYTFQSRSVVDMLETLKAKFLQEQQDLRLEETKKVNAHSTLKLVLEGQIAAATSSRDDKAGFKTTAAQKLAAAKRDLDEAQSSLAADSKYHKDLKAECTKKTTDFKKRQQLRNAELVAIQQATDIISGNSVLAAADKHSRLVQLQSQGTALIASFSTLRQPDLKKAVGILQRGAAELRSSELKMVVQQAASLMQEAPSGAVKIDASVIKQIKSTMQQLLDKMSEQQQSEISQKSYCDQEMGLNKLKRADKTEAVDSLNAEIDALSTTVTKLSGETAELSADITKIAGAMATATSLRQDEEGENMATVTEAKEAQEAVSKAMNVLQDFYQQAGKDAALLQTDSKHATSHLQPQPYKGMQAAGSGVIGLLESIMEDFSRLEVETLASETSAAREYQDFMTDSKVDKAEKETSLANKKNDINTQKSTIAQKTNDLQLSEEQLDAAEKEYATLKDECVGRAAAAAKETAKREAEIKNLKQALEALSGNLR
eukprot:TRINITY_DN17702_c0_g1_i1.p1 TRINITY_DN17702_c0_g1~~TRINITY_DN17702_c0_g1_i1.p1  ORF type:complete len:686 (+),score=214.32 TRINITY_DN17702_c0_g1_i1:129-2186(+)